MKNHKINIKKFILKNAKWLVLFFCTAGFLLIAKNVLLKKYMNIDSFVYNFISNYIISDFVTPAVKFITNLGGPICLTLAALILFIVIKDKKIGIAIILNLGISALLNQLLKQIFQRPRPNVFRIITEKGFSFPSGHSMASTAFYGFFIYLIFKSVKNKSIKWISIFLLGMLILNIGFSRIYLGVHYTSDVLAGFLISISYLIIYTEILHKIISKNKPTENSFLQKQQE